MTLLLIIWLSFLFKEVYAIIIEEYLPLNKNRTLAQQLVRTQTSKDKIEHHLRCTRWATFKFGALSI